MVLAIIQRFSDFLETVLLPKNIYFLAYFYFIFVEFVIESFNMKNRV